MTVIRMKVTCRTWTIAIAAIASALSTHSQAAVGRTPGIFEVAATGEATYTIPLWMPPGPNGLQPELALAYSSGSDNGVLGVGWTLSGLSAIERCPSTPAQDGVAGGPDLTSSDRFCLNGNRLRLVSGGPYGAANTTYQTELQTFATITAYGGTVATGPDYFVMVDRSERTYEFGVTADSRVVPGTSGVPVRWKLNRVQDAWGNSYAVTYSNITGFAVPETISWTPTGAGQSTYRYLARFNYSTDRVDPFSGYIRGHFIQNNRRLDSVQIESAGAVIRKYVLTYELGPVSKRSRLTRFKECSDGAASNCLADTVISYQNGTLGVSSAASTIVSDSNGLYGGAGAHESPQDFNGDGRHDLLYTASGSWRVVFGTATGFSAAHTIPTIGASTAIVAGRFAADGKDGVLGAVGGAWRYYSWNGSGFSETQTSTPANENSIASDINGDQLQDLVWRVNNQVFTRLNTSTSGAASPAFSASSQLGATIPVGTPTSPLSLLTDFVPSRPDLDGDGRQDVLLIKVEVFPIGPGWPEPGSQEPLHYAVPLLSRGATFELAPPIHLGQVPNIRFLRFNDDACSDWTTDLNIHVSPCANSPASIVNNPFQQIVSGILDWDSDGRDDLLYNNGGTVGVFRSLGTAIDTVPLVTSVPYTTGHYFTLDPNGDGLNDLAHRAFAASSPVIYYKRQEIIDGDSSVTGIPDLATQFSDGHGVTYAPAYTTTTRDTSYVSATTVGGLIPHLDPLLIVKSVVRSDGTGGTYTTTYNYAEGRIDHGRISFAGFAQRRETDSRNGLHSRSTYLQAFPFTGQMAKEELLKADGATRIWEQTLTYESHVYAGGTVHFPYVRTSTAKQFDLASNALLFTDTTTDTFDYATGTLTNSTTNVIQEASASDPQVTYARTIDRTLSTVCSGRPEAITDSGSVNGAETVTRKTTTLWSAAPCRATDIIVEPDLAAWRLTSTLDYDAFGNIDAVTQSVDASHQLPARVSSMSWGTTGQFPQTLTNALNQTAAIGWHPDLGLRTSLQLPVAARRP